MLNDKHSPLDKGTYTSALEHYNSCEQDFALDKFALHKDHLEIIALCYLPNVIKNLTPVIELKYRYLDIKNHLKIKNL